jgi:quercetin 2,3-dioxygenase
MIERKPVEIIRAQRASDGNGVKLLRVFGGSRVQRFDPFLMLDEFGSREASDYIGGFPPHPHRGFETVTYMLQGKMEHRDHMGNIGLLKDGDVQWMTAGRGVIHSEMPQQTEGRMHGFQLWLNLPAAQKMTPASYRDVPSEQIPRYELPGMGVKAIAGSALVADQEVVGHCQRPDTQPLFLDIALQVDKTLELPIPQGHNVMIYVYEGEVLVGDTRVGEQQLVRFGDQGDGLKVLNSSQEMAQFIVLAGKPLDEPIVQYGPFVMNTQQEIEQALADYRAGTLV